MKIRVRAVIIENGQVLLIKRTKEDLVYRVIPGGGVEENETKEDALKRECEEELGVAVEVGASILELPSGKPEISGQMEYFYLCRIVSGVLGTGSGPEFQENFSYIGSYDIEWRKIEDLPTIDLKPEEIKNLLFKKYR